MADDETEKPTTSAGVSTLEAAQKTYPLRESEQMVMEFEPNATTQCTMPSPPKLELVEAKGVTAKIKWEHEDEVQIQQKYQYEICWWSDETEKKKDYTSSTNYMITKLEEGTAYSANVTLVWGSEATRASNTVHFDTAPAPPIELRVENFRSSPHASVVVSFKDINKGRDVRHEVVVEAVTAAADPVVKKTTKRKVMIDELKPGVAYSISVQTKEGDKESDKAYYDTPVTTYPAVPEGVELSHEFGKLRLKWERPEIAPLHYEVQWEANGVSKSSTVEDEKFILDGVRLSTLYRFKVSAVNNAGRSYFSNEQCHQTDPAPPQNIVVQRNNMSPSTSLLVRYEDPDPLPKSYEVIATSLHGECLARVETNNHAAVLNGLTPGQSHYVFVVAVYKDLKSEKAYCIRNTIV